MSKRPSDFVQALRSAHAAFEPASAEESKKNILCTAITYSKISDEFLKSHGVALECCKRIESGIKNVLIIYNRKITELDTYNPLGQEQSSPPARASSLADADFSLFRFRSSKRASEEKRKNLNSLLLFAHPGRLEKQTFLDWGGFLLYWRRNLEKIDSELYDERDAARNSYEKIVSESDSLLSDFKWTIDRAFIDGNVEGIKYNLEQAVTPGCLEYFTKSDQEKLLQYVRECNELLQKAGKNVSPF